MSVLARCKANILKTKCSPRHHLVQCVQIQVYNVMHYLCPYQVKCFLIAQLCLVISQQPLCQGHHASGYLVPHLEQLAQDSHSHLQSNRGRNCSLGNTWKKGYEQKWIREWRSKC